jgi:hypothetical protein
MTTDTSSTTFSLFYTIFYIALVVYMIVVEWKIFEKAGEKGWKIFIPFYNSYIFYKIAHKTKWFWFLLASTIMFVISYIILIVEIIASFVSVFSSNSSSGDKVGLLIIMGILLIASCILMFISSIMQSIGLSRAFGQEDLFAVGLIFVQPVFLGIIAFNNKIQYLDRPNDGLLNVQKNEYQPYNYQQNNNTYNQNYNQQQYNQGYNNQQNPYQNQYNQQNNQNNNF